MSDRHVPLIQLLAHRRGELPDRLTERVQNHLKDGCPTCEEGLVFAARLEEVARRDHLAAPPAEVLARARAVFRPVAPPAFDLSSKVTSFAGLVFDSFLQPAAVPVRSGGRLNRHLLYSDRELFLDVRLEPGEEAEQQSITGQLQSSTLSPEKLADLPVMLVEGPRTVMCTRTNHRGEFAFRTAPRREMALCVVCTDRVVKLSCLPPLTAA